MVKDENNKNFGLILENLFNNDNSIKVKDLRIHLNLNIEKIDISLNIIKNMCLMHCNFWNKNLTQHFPKLYKYNDNLFCQFLNKFIVEKKDIFKSKWYIILNNKQKRICDLIFDNFKNIQYNLSNNNLTLIHGDIHTGNIFYDIYNNEPYFIDWQQCGIGKGVQDLILFIIENFDINNIKIVFPLFKNYYYKILINNNITNYSFLEYENDIKNTISYIPFFKCVFYNTALIDELINKNCPYFYIKKLFYLLELMY